MGTAVTVYDRGNLSDAIDENESELAILQIGWGLNLALGASVALAVVSLIAFFTRHASTTVSDTAVAPSGVTAPRGTEPSMSPAAADGIRELAQLHSEGLLTDEEFRAGKERLLPGLVSPMAAATVQASETPSTASLGKAPVAPMASRGIDDRWLYGVAAGATAVVVIVVALIVGFTGSDEPTSPGNTACPPGQSLNENGYCSR
jgi:hypothetical protein